MEKTTLQKIIDQKTDQIRIAIEQAIDDGAKIERNSINCVTIDNVFLQRDINNGNFAIVLRLESEKVAKLFVPSRDELEKWLRKNMPNLQKSKNK